MILTDIEGFVVLCYNLFDSYLYRIDIVQKVPNFKSRASAVVVFEKPKNNIKFIDLNFFLEVCHVCKINFSISFRFYTM